MKTNYNLLPHNTFGIPARAACFAEYDSTDQLRQILAEYRRTSCNLPLLHIGSGSNLLFLSDFPGLILHSCILGIEELPASDPDYALLRVGSGVVFDDLIAYAVDHSLYGIENLSLIPGEVGASAVQNIGAYGVEAKDAILRVEAIELATGQERTFHSSDCGYGYRQSIFKQQLAGQYAITHVTFRLSRTFRPRLDYGGVRQALQQQGLSEATLTAQQLRQTIIDIRRQKLPDPVVQGNAGSFFMNPVIPMEQFLALQSQYPQMPHYPVDADHEKVPAGWLIEQTGWKGRSLGPAAVHDRQALVLVNRGGATGADILRLCRQVRHDVQQQFHIDLHPEVIFVGTVPE